MGIEDKGYGEKIIQEGTFWDRFEKEANEFGIPWWCDLRRATKLTKIVCGWMYDPRIEKILRGRCKNKLIKAASRTKGNVLDIGCGAGWLSLELARNGMAVNGIEISAKRLEIAREYLRNNLFKENFGSIDYQVADINRIKLKKDKYQSVVSWDTLHHIPTIDRLVKEIYLSLKPRCYFVIYDHIGLKKKNRILIRILQIPLTIFYKIRKLSGIKNVKKKAETGLGGARKIVESPFEDVTGEEMINPIKQYFELEIVETKLCFLANLANSLLGLPDVLKYFLMHLLKFIDDLLIKMHILEGEYIFIIGKSKKAAG